ncbi:MAG: hypothetical protein ACLT98_13305 [Eggerthellaceae bacterium]
MLRDFGIAIDGLVDVVALWALVAASSLISFAYLKASSRYRQEERLAECGQPVGQILSTAKEARMECTRFRMAQEPLVAWIVAPGTR